MNSIDLTEINQNKMLRKIKKGDIIFLGDTPARGFYCISQGKVKITKTVSSTKETIVDIASIGDLIGHHGLFTEKNYGSSAYALEDTYMCFLDKNFILSMVNKSPTVAIAIIKKLCEEKQEYESKFSSLIAGNVRQRLAGLLLSLANTYGSKEGSRIKLNIKLTRDEMASMIGTANETVIRFTSELKDEGIIALEGKTIFILNQKKLMDFATKH